ncbi:uncharacterized protein LOC107616852 [Arachis ipaensis]|uniref:uncharacterized protein LOC107616852 n=1 Tax=Arachis ipaensis TaxID=130454 RepID=UPI0007AEED16|nr:uncharacterized protein LOC107616852 [Arachis ipaensis]
MLFFSHRRLVPPPSLTPLLQIVALPSKSAISPCHVVHFSPPPPLVTYSPATTTTVSPILVSRALSERKSGVSLIKEHSDLSIWNRREDGIVFTLYCNVFLCFLLIVDSLLGLLTVSNQGYLMIFCSLSLVIKFGYVNLGLESDNSRLLVLICPSL